METPKFSRRIFLKTMLAALLAAGCSPLPKTETGDGISIPAILNPATDTPSPTPTPTALPFPDVVIADYLSAWEALDFAAMFALLTPESQTRVPASEFQTVHQQVFEQTTAQSIDLEKGNIQIQADRALLNFSATWHTALFGEMKTEHQMTLRFVSAGWRVLWEPMVLLPQLGYGVTLTLLEEKFPRGEILDAQDRLLATNGSAIRVGVVPQNIVDRASLISILSPIVGLDAATINAKIDSARPDWFVPLGEIYPDTAAELAIQLETPGIEARKHPARQYPFGENAAHLIGYLGGITAENLNAFKKRGYKGDEIIGKTGLENWGEPFLAGKRGGRLVTIAPDGDELEEIAKAIPHPGGNIYLSLDIELQARAEQILGARRGSIIVMQPNGFIKAMASYPRFNPQDFATGANTTTWSSLLNNPDSPLINRPTLGIYPPASIFKIISMAAAMEKLDWSPQKTFNCTGTWYGLGENFPKKCWLKTGHGNISLQDGLTQSCDVVFYEVGKALYEADPNFLPDMARTFGLGQPTGISGVDEFAGVVPDDAWKKATYGEAFYVGDGVNMAIGQGFVLATPLQIAQMMATLANDKTHFRPQIVRQLSARDSGDQFFEAEAMEALPITDWTLASIQAGLYGVAQGRRGTAREAFDGASFSVVGKTGTAETGIDEPHAWFAGYAPADNPQVVIVVMLENAGEGSEMAAPLFRLMAESYFAQT